MPESIDFIETVVSKGPCLKSIVLRYVPDLRSAPLYPGVSFVPTLKSVPSGAWFTRP